MKFNISTFRYTRSSVTSPDFPAITRVASSIIGTCYIDAISIAFLKHSGFSPVVKIVAEHLDVLNKKEL